MSVTYLTHIFIVCCLFATLSFAWLSPERCDQTKRKISRRSTDTSVVLAPIVPKIDRVASVQNRHLNKKYKNYEFVRAPAFVNYTNDFINDFGWNDSDPFTIYTGDDCKFHTYGPSLLASVWCDANTACKLARTVSTTDTYASTEGYNWNVKVSAKLSLLEKVIEVGGEVAVGGTYSCAFTQSKAVTQNVECAVAARDNESTLQLYSVKTDMRCKIGSVLMEPELRNGEHRCYSRDFPESVGKIARESFAHFVYNGRNRGLLDPSKISESTLRKILKICPLYNIYTDVVGVGLYIFSHHDYNEMQIFYHKASKMTDGIDTLIPFTNEAGNSEYQYACVLD